MDFGYFTLSDNRYPGNQRSAEQLIGEIYEQALWAETVGLNSAWIGEHHFNLLGVNACPNILLAKIAGATRRIRLAPAVVLLPVHHPLHVAEEWATLDLLSGGRLVRCAPMSSIRPIRKRRRITGARASSAISTTP